MRVIVVIFFLLVSGYAYGQNYCMGTTKSGNPCNKNVSKAYSYCASHNVAAAPKDHCFQILSSGEYCKNLAKKNSTYCGTHQSGYAKQPQSTWGTWSGSSSGVASGQCAGTTKAGERCKRMTTTTYCYQHGN